MCTVSVIAAVNPDGPLCRIVCNRDEQRLRPRAVPPAVHTLGARRMLMPVDPQSGGTWIGVNDLGLAALLLNRTLPTSPPLDNPESRGSIIPHLLAAGGDTALRRAMSLDARRYPPFRLLLVSLHGSVEFASDGQSMQLVRAYASRVPVMLTSSGLGDHKVEGPRRALFEQLIDPACALAAQQDAFHNHRWPDRSPLSVRMSRPDARTVSRTVLEISESAATMTHFDLADDEGGSAHIAGHAVLHRAAPAPPPEATV